MSSLGQMMQPHGECIRIEVRYQIDFCIEDPQARWEAIGNFARPQARLEACAPPMLDPQRTPDGSTVRRWMGWAKPLLGIGCRKIAATRNRWSPTILAWDFQQVLFKLNPEARAG